jgi:hypothetical protein
MAAPRTVGHSSICMFSAFSSSSGSSSRSDTTDEAAAASWSLTLSSGGLDAAWDCEQQLLCLAQADVCWLLLGGSVFGAVELAAGALRLVSQPELDMPAV